MSKKAFAKIVAGLNDALEIARGYSVTELRICAAREAGMRRKIYPNRILTGRLSRQKADAEIAMMDAIVALLVEIEEGERLL